MLFIYIVLLDVCVRKRHINYTTTQHMFIDSNILLRDFRRGTSRLRGPEASESEISSAIASEIGADWNRIDSGRELNRIGNVIDSEVESDP